MDLIAFYKSGVSESRSGVQDSDRNNSPKARTLENRKMENEGSNGANRSRSET